MKKKLLAVIMTLVLVISFIVPVYAGSACEALPYPEEYQRQIVIEFLGVSMTRGPGGGGQQPPPTTN